MLKWLGALLAAKCVKPASAKDFLVSAGGWTVSDIDGGCGMIQDFEGPGASNVVFAKKVDGTITLHIDNDNWTAKEGETYDVTFALNGSAYSGPAIGVVSSGRHGFFAKMGAGFEVDLARGNGLIVLLGEQQIDNLSLHGTGVALA